MVEPSGQGRVSLKGKTVYVPLMSEEGARSRRPPSALRRGRARLPGFGRAQPGAGPRATSWARNAIPPRSPWAASQGDRVAGFRSGAHGFFMPSSEGPAASGSTPRSSRRSSATSGTRTCSSSPLEPLRLSGHAGAGRQLRAHDMARPGGGGYPAQAAPEDPSLRDRGGNDGPPAGGGAGRLRRRPLREDLNHGQRLKALVAALTSARTSCAPSSGAGRTVP